MSVIFYTFSISLFDSLSTTLQIIIFVLLLTTTHPIRNALFYLAGLSGAYYFCGFAGYFALDDLRLFLKQFFPSMDSISNPLYYQSELLTGVVMVAIGIWYYFRKKKAPQGRAENMIISRLKTMNSLFAFVAGAFISITSFPVSIPYLIALGKYSTLQLELPALCGYILLYNIGYALPMVLILAIYLVARRNTDDYHDALHEKARMLNVHLTTWTFIGFGIFSMIDAGCYFTLGHALVKGRYF